LFQCQIAQFDRGVCFSEEADEARTDRNDPRRIGSGQNPEVDEPSLHTAPLSVPVSQKPTQRTMMNADCKASFICRSPWGVSWSYQIPRRLICYGPGVCVVGGASPDFARSRFFYFFFVELDNTLIVQTLCNATLPRQTPFERASPLRYGAGGKRMSPGLTGEGQSRSQPSPP
jgi:hypothetical protein